MNTLSNPLHMAKWAIQQKAAGQTIGLVPTMGALHGGHTSLFDLLRPLVDQLVVSIYVNPLQFAPTEDLSTYPRDVPADLAVCRAHGVNAVFAPNDLYPSGFCTTVEVAGLTDVLCGASRPTLFAGVTTACTRLLLLTRADVACFGEKDYQQLCVIRRLVRDLGLPVHIRSGPVVRDRSGLARSSRNRYLSPGERTRARSLSAALQAVHAAYTAGERDAQALVATGLAVLDVDRLDYFEIRDAHDLSSVSTLTKPARVFVAAYLGAKPTRLIDNWKLG